MSHKATEWAFRQRGLKPAAKLVLLALADRHNPDMGCFPAHETIASDCEMSERSVRDQLNLLETRKLIKRQKFRVAGQFAKTRYLLAFEVDLQRQDLPSAKSASGKNKRVPTANSDRHQRQNLPTNLVKEPLREPVRRAAARKAGVGSENPGSCRETEPPPLGPEVLAPAFDRFWTAFPDPVEREAASKAFAGVIEAGEISPDDLVEAAAAYARSRHVERGYGMKPANWLARGGWRDEWQAGKAAKDAAPPNVDLDALAERWVEAVRAGRTYAASSIKPHVARHMLSRQLVTETELRRAGVTL